MVRSDVIRVPASVRAELAELLDDIEVTLGGHSDREYCLQGAFYRLESVLTDLEGMA